jgi:hypothetical protein
MNIDSSRFGTVSIVGVYAGRVDRTGSAIDRPPDLRTANYLNLAYRPVGAAPNHRGIGSPSR